MNSAPQKSDFVLNSYMESNDLRATWQIVNTLIPYFGLWAFAFYGSQISLWILPPTIALIVLFSLRCFSLMHDCGHNALFRSKAVNRIVGFVLGWVNTMPQYWWARDHAFHHKTNGDWERYRGIGDFLSTDEYVLLSAKDKKIYGIIRHPLTTFPGGLFYLAFKPRLILVAGLYDWIREGIVALKPSSDTHISDVIASHRSKYWGSNAEFWDVLLNNMVVVSSWALFCHWMGAGFFLGVYAIVLTISAALFILIFFVQHNFEGTYAHKTEGWDYFLGATKGSSYLEMPEILKWFTADISYHNIHHLSERIPNYNLRACHQENIHLLGNIKTLRLSDVKHCTKFILWDAAAERLVSIDEFG